MRSATHTGTCQICGHHQMLPSGKLAKHGYTTRWGFFSGTCSGSGYRPFETHTDRIEDAVARAKDTAKRLRAEAKALRGSDDVSKVWRHVYQQATYSDRTSRYVWQLLDVTVVDGKATVVETRREMSGAEKQKTVTLDGTAADAVRRCNGVRADALDKEAKQYDGYVAWQTERLATWKPQPLQARADGGERKGPLVHFGLHWSGRGKACASSVMASQTGHTTYNMAAVTCDKCKQTTKWQEAQALAAEHGGSYTLRYKSGDTVTVKA